MSVYVIRRIGVIAVVGLAACSRWATAPRFGSLEAGPRPFQFQHGIELFKAKNGMRVALLRDTGTNLVTVDVRYTVGAAEDPPGRAGMAHLVEHLMFEARATQDGPTIGDRLADVALYHNAWTNHDETHYMANALGTDLGALLDLEAERMQVTCDQISEELFLRERDVVLEETAWRSDSNTEAMVGVAAAVWGDKHPYGRAVASPEIARATRAEACQFIADHYGADRAILVVTGNFDLEPTMAHIAEKFGPIARKSAAPRAEIAAPALDGATSEHVADIDEATALVYFEAPAWGTDGFAPYSMVSAYLAYELGELDDRHAWITATWIGQSATYRATTMIVAVSVDDPERLRDAVDAVFDATRSLGERTAWAAVDVFRGRLRTEYMASWDSFASRGSWLADFLMYTSHNWFFLRELGALDELKETDLPAWAKQRLVREKSHVALVRPSGKDPIATRVDPAASSREHDLQPWRSPVNPADAARPLELPTTRTATKVVERELPNGLRVLLAPDAKSPIVDARLVFPVGRAADPADRRGVAYAAARLLDHDLDAVYDGKDANKLDWVLKLGTYLGTDVDEESTTFSARGLALFADWHVWRLFWLLDQGHYPDDDVASWRRGVAAVLGDGERDVRDDTLRTLLFGKGHPYAAPRMTGAEAKRIGTSELAAFRKRFYRARGATLIVAGGFDVDAMQKEIDELFGAWSGDQPDTQPPVPPVEPARGPHVLGVRDPDEPQPHLTIAFAPRSNPEKDRAARMILAEIVQDRVRVAREGLGATYAVSVQYGGGAGGGVFEIETSLDPSRAGKALAALIRELSAIREGGDAIAADFVRARRRAVARALADAAGTGDLVAELAFVARNQLPVGYLEKLTRAIAETTFADVTALAGRDLAEDRMVLVLSGRAAVIEGAFQHAGLQPKMLDVE